MKYFYLIANRQKKRAQEKASYIQNYIKDHGGVCYRAEEELKEQSAGHKYTDAAQIPEQVECVITLGGDGTLIQAARELSSRNLPLVGINIGGHLGYLTQISKEGELSMLLDHLMADRYQLESRMMLEGKACQKGLPYYKDMALNDIVITRKGLLRVLKFRIYVNGEFLNGYTADGMIIATPTGSTAYNLSAGGPIVAPHAQMIILTPICPHTMNTRSVVLSSEDQVKIEILGDDDTGQVAVFDGDTAIELKVGDFIEIEKSKIQTRLVKLNNISFLDNLRNKMTGI